MTLRKSADRRGDDLAAAQSFLPTAETKRAEGQVSGAVTVVRQSRGGGPTEPRTGDALAAQIAGRLENEHTVGTGCLAEARDNVRHFAPPVGCRQKRTGCPAYRFEHGISAVQRILSNAPLGDVLGRAPESSERPGLEIEHRQGADQEMADVSIAGGDGARRISEWGPFLELGQSNSRRGEITEIEQRSAFDLDWLETQGLEYPCRNERQIQIGVRFPHPVRDQPREVVETAANVDDA